MVRLGSTRSSHAGIHQVRSPSIVSSAGTIVMRTINASVRIAMPSSRPNSFVTRSSPIVKEKNTELMISAAATITRPTPAMPSTSERRVSLPRRCSSRTRLIRNTS